LDGDTLMNEYVKENCTCEEVRKDDVLITLRVEANEGYILKIPNGDTFDYCHGISIPAKIVDTVFPQIESIPENETEEL